MMVVGRRTCHWIGGVAAKYLMKTLCISRDVRAKRGKQEVENEAQTKLEGPVDVPSSNRLGQNGVHTIVRYRWPILHDWHDWAIKPELLVTLFWKRALATAA